MVREVKEEVGFDVEAVKLTDVADTITLDSNGRVQYHFVVVNFVARIVGGELKTATDILEAKWVPVEEVEKQDLTKSFRAFFEKHKNEIMRLVGV
jgi:8-oxo-dGTP diphosphatase